MRLTPLICATGLSVFVLMGHAQPSMAQAYPYYPYCGYYGGRGDASPGTPVCGFNTLQQCAAAVSGSQGYCDVNPWYVPSATRQKRTRV